MGRYTGKYRKKKNIPMTSWVLIGLAVLGLMVGGVKAYLSASTVAVRNDFAADESTDPEIQETFDGDVKSDVAVDVGTPGYAVYVRAAIVVTWKDEDGNVYGAGPVQDVDYTMTVGDGWFKGSDRFYYYENPVAYNGTDKSSQLTANLINTCAPIAGKAPEGYGLNVEIIAQTIQAVGTTGTQDNSPGTPAVTDAWGVAVENGKLKPSA